MAGTSFAISYSPALKPLLRIMGLGPRTSEVVVDEDTVRVRMGWGFRARIAGSQVRSAVRTTGRVGGWGVHGGRGIWLVNGSSQGLVELTLDPPAPARAVGFPVALRRLRVSLCDADGFLAALGRPAATG